MVGITDIMPIDQVNEVDSWPGDRSLFCIMQPVITSPVIQHPVISVPFVYCDTEYIMIRTDLYHDKFSCIMAVLTVCEII